MTAFASVDKLMLLVILWSSFGVCLGMVGANVERLFKSSADSEGESTYFLLDRGSDGRE